MKLTVTTMLLAVFALPSHLALAAPSAKQLRHDRTQFEQALSHLNKNQVTEFRALQQELQDYPLAIYLDYHYLLKNLNHVSQGQIVSFINRASDSPLAERLHKKWLNHLAKQQRWETYLTQYAISPLPETHYICQKLVAELNTGQAQQALSQAAELWQVGYSQPKSCDPLFSAWMKQGHPTTHEANNRFWNALADEELGIAKYASRFVTEPSLQQQHKHFWNLYHNPAQITANSLQSIDKSHRPAALSLIFKGWFKQHPISATEQWLKLRDKLLPRDQQLPITEYIALRHNWRYHPDAIRFSAALDPEYTLPLLTESRIRNALREQDWRAVTQGIAHLPADKKDNPAWRYWALIAQQHLDPAADIQPQLEQLAQDRSYYGFLSAELSNSRFQLNPQATPLDPEALENIANLPAITRAKELYQLGRLIEANREWYAVKQTLNQTQQRLAARLAHQWGWHLQAIIIAAQTEDWDNISHRFPQPHASLFKSHAIKQGLDLSFPIAIARQESAFLSNAHSHAGARGLMQLMPATAKMTAKRHKVPYRNTSQLNNPNTNVALGSAYLSDMMQRFQGNPAYAAAAYNAGPHRVKRWLKDRGHLPLDVWIETIPFSETRKYVQNVLAYRVIYDRLDGRQANLMNERQLAQLTLNLTRPSARLQ
ncbi:transglycosylase SLT domain-containing protein [Pontibacter sp. JAM-7]|uniref:transglycosylase SLT domain-containing protein n=1 Tax=Pontibacter sp. JAM-7 TaxID=3366581 RepID=UPI003AF8C27A